jgi:hypothetical protein
MGLKNIVLLVSGLMVFPMIYFSSYHMTRMVVVCGLAWSVGYWYNQWDKHNEK